MHRTLEKERRLLILKRKYLTKGGALLKTDHKSIGNIAILSPKQWPSQTEEAADLLLRALAQQYHL